MPTRDLHDDPFDPGTIAKLEIFEGYAQMWIPTWVFGSSAGLQNALARMFGNSASMQNTVSSMFGLHARLRNAV